MRVIESKITLPVLIFNAQTLVLCEKPSSKLRVVLVQVLNQAVFDV